MAKQLTKEEFIEVAKEFGYDTDGEYSNYVAIYLNNERAADNLIAWLDAETKRDGCYDIRLDCMVDHLEDLYKKRTRYYKKAQIKNIALQEHIYDSSGI